MLTVIETPIYLRHASKLFSEDERYEFISWLAQYPEAGDVIPDTQGLRKVRWAREGMGKRGGARVIYFLRLSQGEIVLLIAYGKSQRENLSSAFLRELRKLAGV